MNAYLLLGLSIICEVFGSSMLKATNGFKNLFPTIGVLVSYGIAFYGLSLALKTLSLGTAFAIWAGLGTALTALVGITIYKEKMNGKIIFGLTFIVFGVILLNLGGGH
ncbi:DMT family transporter [Salirhabdus salicampi]|uniref:DMT family transporter n=1 Tax=Salirhabdus salicampi TaxID=476102 RepID=UPI0020C3B9F6|nr:SMR family transporter [Salirhabdus salicampi]MCP8617240.1 SMR family transporter [Salirhabdus salicampi]